MRKPPVFESTQVQFAPERTSKLAVLSISPIREDHLAIEMIVTQPGWTLFKADDLASAAALFPKSEIGVVICERDLPRGTWIDVLEYLNGQSNRPSLIVTSRLADERLWAEALNLGAWDVLAKPFDRSEVIRSVKSAWRHWSGRTPAPALVMKAMSAA